MTPPDALCAFFDEFVGTIDGTEIAFRYFPPYVSVRADGTSARFSTITAIAGYFQ